MNGDIHPLLVFAPLLSSLLSVPIWWYIKWTKSHKQKNQWPRYKLGYMKLLWHLLVWASIGCSGFFAVVGHEAKGLTMLFLSTIIWATLPLTHRHLHPVWGLLVVWFSGLAWSMLAKHIWT
jgi:hypothetical protein